MVEDVVLEVPPVIVMDAENAETTQGENGQGSTPANKINLRIDLLILQPQKKSILWLLKGSLGLLLPRLAGRSKSFMVSLLLLFS